VAVKVLGAEGSGYLDTVASGIIYAADIGAKVINLSLAGPMGAQTLENAVNYAWDSGALVVAAAGNDGADTRVYPAAYANAIAVASTNEEDHRSCFSNYGEGYISVAAPGELILGAVPDQGYGTYSGTSLSAPHVSGLGGLLFSKDPAPTNEQARTLIETTSEDLGATGTDAYFGTGRINAHRAVTGDDSQTIPPAGLFSDDITASGYAHARKLARDVSGTLHLVWHSRDGEQYRVLYATSSDGGVTWIGPDIVFESSAETYHPALAVDETTIYVAFPTKHNSSRYRIFFRRKPLSGGTWSPPLILMGDPYHAVRPDLYYDPSNGTLHLVASSFDDAPYVYHTSSEDGGGNWSEVSQVNVDSTGGQRTRYADVHANGSNIYIAGRTVEFTWFGLIPRYRVFTIRYSDNGDTWGDLTELAVYDGLFSGEYGASLAGAGDRLYLAYEHAGAVYFRRSEDGAAWSGAENVGSGAWPSMTQATDGQAWLMWGSGGNLSLRHYTGTAWDPAETVGGGNYPNLKLGTTGGFFEWVATHCSGAPFRLIYGSHGLVANNPPVANDVSATGDEDSVIPWTPSVSDPDQDPLTCSIVSQPTNGSASVDSDCASGTYTPNLDFNRSDSFTYKANDGKEDSNIAAVSVTVNPVNDAPVANDDSATTQEDTPITIDVLANDTDVDGDTLTVTNLAQPSNGTATLDAGPTVTYAPNPGFVGEDTFTYTANDGTFDSNVATVTVTVEAVNDPPVASDDSAATQEDTPVTIDVLANDTDPDGDALTVTNLTQPSNGTATLNADQTVTYTPKADFNGTDSFTYTANDGKDDSNVATVTVTVEAVNDAPVANNDSATTQEDTAVTINVLANDTDPDGDALTVPNLTQPSNGTAILNPEQTVTYTPNPGFVGDDTFTYTANDGTLDSNVATVTVAVNPGVPTAYVRIDMSKRSIWKWWRATATVTITENAAGGPPIAGATVEANWSGAYERNVSGTTNKDGKVSFRTGWITNSGNVCFTVDRVVKDGQEYDLDGNAADCISGGSSRSRSSGE